MTIERENSYDKIAVLDNLIEAQVLTSILEAEQIPHRIRSLHDTAYDGLFQFHMGWGIVYAPPQHGAFIRQTLERIRTGELTEAPPSN